MALKGIKPEIVVPSKPKIMLTGPAGGGKSYFALNAPAPYYIDTEAGANREQYMKKLVSSGGEYMGVSQGSQDIQEIVSQVRELATTKHKFRTIVIDSLTKPYNMEIHAAEDRGVSPEFKKSKREADRSMRKLIHWLTRPDLDLCVIIICHPKDKWTREGTQLVKEGTTWDGPEKLDHELDLWLETKVSGRKWYATVKKSRVEQFPLSSEIDLDFENFKKMYGAAVVDSPVKPIILANEEQVKEIKRLVELLNVPEDEFDKWLVKAQATEVEDLSAENAEKMLKFLNGKIKGETK